MSNSNRSPKLILHGFKTRYSSWTARVVLVLEFFEIPYDGRYYNIYDPDSRPSGAQFKERLYPMLQPHEQDPHFIIDESLAICEYLAESFPDRELWPRDAKLRALARGAAAQMHAGFTELRNTYHSNFVAKYTGKVPVSEAALQEISKLLSIWDQARTRTKERLQELGAQDEGFLFGRFSIADAFFWPILWRFRSYQLPLDGITSDAVEWMAAMWNHPVLKAQAHDYFEQAADPTTKVDRYDDIFRGNSEVQYAVFDESWEFSM